MTTGPDWASRGGILHPGITLAVNNTDEPEPVLIPDQLPPEPGAES